MKKYIFISLVTLLALGSCKDEPEFGDALYMTGTLQSSTVRFLVEGESSTALTVSSTSKATEDINITLNAAPELLDAYNASTGRNCQMPPDGSYSIDGSTVTIEAGKAMSSSLKVTADGDALQEGVSYCIPISITEVSNGQKVFENSRTAYVMITKVIDIKVAYLAKTYSYDIPSFGTDSSPVKALSAMTLEMKVKPIKFGSFISSLVGCEENFLFRFGDGAGNPETKLQLAKASIGAASNPDQKDHYEAWAPGEFQEGTWYHFAAVYDGHYLRIYLDGEQIFYVETTRGGTINLSVAYDGHTWDDTFAIGRSVGHQRMFNGCVSECRVWNIARTQTQLQDGVCYVDPTSDGLLAYWRFNGELQDDGSVRDETGHGYDAYPSGTPQWMDNQKCPF